MAPRFLGGLLETKKANPKEASLRASGRALSSGTMPLGVAGPWDMDKAVKDGLEKVSWVYRCVDAISQTQARIPMEQRRISFKAGRDAAEVVEDEAVWKLLNYKSNPYESSFQFRYRLSATLLLSRRGAFVEMVRDGSGNVVELHLMSPGMVEPIPDPKTFVSGYKIMRGDFVEDIVEPERVCWIKIKPHPSDPYSQLTPLMSVGIAVETNFLAHTFNRNFLANDGKPATLIAVKGELSDEDAKELKMRFSGGPMQAGTTSVIDGGDGVDVNDLSASPRDVQWGELQKISKEEIMSAFGVPESVTGNASGRTFDNADAERENYYVDTVQTHCDPIAYGLDPITGSTEDNLIISFDYSGVDVLQRIAQRKREEKRTEVGAGLSTVDEYRDFANLDPFDVPITRALILPNGVVATRDDADQEAVTAMSPVPSQSGGAPGEEAPMQEAATQGRQSLQGALQGVRQGLAEANRQRGNQDAAQSVRDRLSVIQGGKKSYIPVETKTQRSIDTEAQRPSIGLRYKTEGLIEGALTSWDAEQEKVIISRLDHVKFKQGTRHFESKALPKTQKCKYGDHPATHRILHAEGMAYIPVCEDHLAKGKSDIGQNEVSAVHTIADDNRKQEKNLPIRELKKLNPRYAVDTEEWAKELTSVLGDTVRKAMIREARKSVKNLKIDGVGQFVKMPTNTELEELLQPHYEAVMEVIEKAAQNQSGRVIKTIEDMDEGRSSIREIQRAVRNLIAVRGPWRKALSKNVTTHAIEAARGAVYDRAKNFYTKTWITENDERVRHSHRKADGQTRMVRNKFTVGGVKMDRPGDPTAPIQEVANCRCFVRYQLSDTAFKRMEGRRA